MFPRSITALPGVKRILTLLFVFTTLRALCIIAQTWFLACVIVELWLGEGLEAQAVRIALFLLCFMCGHMVALIQDKQLSSYAKEQAERLRNELLKEVFTLGPALTQARGTGSTTTTVLEGIDNVETYIRLMLPKIAGLVTIPVLLLVVVFIVDWVSGLVLLLTVPIVVVFMIILGKTAEKRASRQYKVFQRLSNHFIDSLRGLDTLKLFGISRRYAQNVFKVSEQFRKATMATLRVVTLSGAVLDFFSTLAIAIVAVFLGVRLLDGSLQFFPALVSLILAPEYFRPIRDFAADYHASLDGKNALESIQGIITRSLNPSTAPTSPSSPSASLSTEPANQCSSFVSPSMAKDFSKDSHFVIPSIARNLSVDTQQGILNEASNHTAYTPVPLWQNDSLLTVTDLKFSHDGVPVLSDVSFSVRGYSKIGIIGMSGAGKSSLINILSGFWLPDSARIEIDIQRIPSFKQQAWQKQLIYIPQEPYIFHASLRDNIVFYHPEATDAELTEAVERAGLQELVSQLPEGLETLVGEGARALSGGQAQRVALARAFFDRDRKILIVDEPTAHLDIETELELKERMLPLMQDRLIFFATHRLHWMKEMDYILVLDKGRIVEEGTADELLKKKGAFAAFVEQSKGV